MIDFLVSGIIGLLMVAATVLLLLLSIYFVARVILRKKVSLRDCFLVMVNFLMPISWWR